MHNTMAPWLLRSFLQKSFPTIIVAAVFMLTSMSFVVPAQSQVEIIPSWDYNPVLHHTRIADDKIETNTVAAGDLDGDGDVDFVTQRTWRGLTILMNDGFGNFTVQQEIDGIGPWAVGVADIDGDGDLDILPSNGNVHVLFNDGSANFTPSTSGGGWAGTRVDIDNDGDLDVIGGGIFDVNTGVFKIRFNDGRGDLTPYRADEWVYSLPNGVYQSYLRGATAPPHMRMSRGIQARDINNDGNIDLLVNAYHCCHQPGGADKESSLLVYLGDGLGNFTLDFEYVVPNRIIRLDSALLADMDIDGHLDIVAVWDPCSQVVACIGAQDYSVAVLYSNGLGGYSEPVLTPVWSDRHLGYRYWTANLNRDTYDSPIKGLKVIDVQHDGRPDIVGVSRFGVTLLENTMHGLVERWITGLNDSYHTTVHHSVTVADLDGDGAQDLVIPLMTNSRGSRSRPHVDVVTIFNTTPQLLAPPVASFP